MYSSIARIRTQDKHSDDKEHKLDNTGLGNVG
jgi:hypothetical protein